MPLYFLRIRNVPYGNLADLGIDAANDDAAWTEITRVFSDLVGDVTKELKQNTEWQIELLDASRRPLFRIGIVAETLRIDGTILPGPAQLG